MSVRRTLTETRPFLVTSEFVLGVVFLVGLAFATAASDSLDASLAWRLVVAVGTGYLLSRGFAKANAPSTSWDPRETFRPHRQASGGSTRNAEQRRGERMSTQQQEYGYEQGAPAYQRGWGGHGGRQYAMREAFPIETKPFFLTSEFWAAVALIVGLAIAASSSDGIDDRLFWTLATAVTSVYILSRGIAKSGTKSRSWDPREEGMQRLRERASRDD